MIRHIATSIDGLLQESDYRLKKLAPYCTVDGKPLKTAGQVKKMLRQAKALGMVVIPCPECDNYDEKGYCKGHDRKNQPKTPDEIKKGLRHCSEDGCKGCPYKEDCDMAVGFSVLAYDALAYIQKLEEREWELFDLLSSVWHGKQYYFKQEDGSVYGRESCQYLTFDQAIDEFAHSLTVAGDINVPNWISVEERLPEPFVSVIVYVPEEEPLPQVHEGYITPDGVWHSVLYVETYNRVSHWMPMPQPPNEDE